MTRSFMIVVAGYLLAWFGYLIFCGWLVKLTKQPDALRHAATAARAFPFKSMSWLGDLIARLTSRKPPPRDPDSS